MATTRNKGLKDIYVAPVTVNTSTTYTAGTPVKLAKAIGAKITEKWNSEDVYADDCLEDTMRDFGSIDIELEVNKLTNTHKALLYGKTLSEGGLVSSSADNATDVAIGFRSKTGTGKYDFTWIYCCKVSDGDSKDYNTQEGKPKSTTDKIKLTGRVREKDSYYRFDVNEDELLEADTDAHTAITNWFASVKEPV